MRNLISILFLSLLLSFNSWATPIAEVSAVIPEQSIRPEATDLIFQGKSLTSEEARRLEKSGQDISFINPDETTDIWRSSTSEQSDSLGIQSQEEVEFIQILSTPVKNFRFIISKIGSNGERQLFQAFLGKRLQTYLLRRNLLRKLGYVIPPMQYVPRLDVRFKTASLRNDFIDNKIQGLKWNALGDKEWILNLDDRESDLVALQDVAIMPVQAEITNVALGVMTPDFILGRRVLNSLFVPYALVDVRESINGFRWYPGLRKSNAVYLPLEDPEQFSTTWSDARWILRRIAKLNRYDFESIVSGIGYPEAAQKLLVEKLISRRNELIRLFKLDEPALAFNPGISFGEHLKEGELLKGEWPGIAPRLAFEEEPSLVSGKELGSLLKSKAISTVIQELVRRVNTELIPHTDLEKIVFEKQKDKFLDDLVEFVKTGKAPKRDFGVWTAPFISGKIIASREVIAGSYLGTDNRVQLVDSLGFGIDTGLYVGTIDLKPKQLLDGRLGLSYLRQYSHLRPLTSIDAALKEPYKNMLVPLLQRKWASSITPELFSGWEGLPEEEKLSRVKTVISEFKDQLGDGESLVITDNIVGSAAIRAGYNFAERVKAQADINGQKVVLSRLHILRQGDTIHVYKDLGNIQSLSLVIGLKAGIEVMSLKASFTGGTARTHFYKVSMNTNDEPSSLAVRMQGLRELLFEKGIGRLSNSVEPNRLTHDLGEKQFAANFLFWNYLKLLSTDWLNLKRSGGLESENYFRRFIGERNGRDFQTVAVHLVNEIVQELTDVPVEVANSTSGDPADTLYGKSRARVGYYEAELNEDKTSIEESFIGISYRWRGWKAKRNQIEKIITQFSKRFNFTFFNPESFEQVKSAELYTLNLRVFVYEKGIRHAMGLDSRKLYKIMQSEWVGHSSARLSELTKAHQSLVKQQAKYLKSTKEMKWDKAGDAALGFISLVEKKLTHNGFKQVVGDERNFWIQPVLMGFLKGEDGKLAEIPIEGNEIGQIGSDRPFGPMTSAQQEMGMSESEFFAYWLLRRI
jgi:hypothetical protein